MDSLYRKQRFLSSEHFSGTGARFSRRAAALELGYDPRSLRESVRDTVLDLLPAGRNG